MIKGTGIDIIKIERIKKILSSTRRERFCKKIFGPDELAYATGKKYEHEHLAGFFAIKESFMKALGEGWRRELRFSDILVNHDKKGKPYLELKGKALELLKKTESSKIHISISHEKEYAIGLVIIEI